MARIIIFLLSIILINTNISLAADPNVTMERPSGQSQNMQYYSGGDGSETDPWQIANKVDLLTMADTPEHYDANFILTADINMSGDIYPTALIAPDTFYGYGFQGTGFSGVFDGKGFKITGLTIDSENNYLGLFGMVDGGVIRNLGLQDCFVSGSQRVGGLVGWNVAGNISNCYSTSQIYGYSDIGGLVGWNSYGCIYNCDSSCQVYGSQNDIGGLVGNNYYAEMWNCNSSGEIFGYSGVGGLIGLNNDCNVAYCYSTAAVNSFANTGGLIGLNKNVSDISNCYSKGTVNGLNNFIGGLIGVNELGNISNSYSVSDVNSLGDYVGTLVGDNFGIVENCFWNTQTQSFGLTEAFGYNYGIVTNVNGLTTQQMQKKNTYTSLPAQWDFVKIWDIGENQTYPYLTDRLACDLNHDQKVDYRDLAILAENWLSNDN